MPQGNDPDSLSRCLASKSRRAILLQLRTGPKSVSDLVEMTGLKQPNVSNHLASMREMGVVGTLPDGRKVFYFITDPYVDSMIKIADLTSSADQSHTSKPHRNGTAVANNNPYLLSIREIYFKTLREGDEDEAISLVNDILSHEVPMLEIYREVFEWCIEKFGTMYLAGEVDVAAEHAASSITERMMARVSQYYMPIKRGTFLAILGCVDGNWHEMGLRMLADALRSEGWKILYLGASVPSESFVDTVVSFKPDLVALSCATHDQVQTLEELVQELRNVRANRKLHFVTALGGNAVDAELPPIELQKDEFCANGINEFLEALNHAHKFSSWNKLLFSQPE